MLTKALSYRGRVIDTSELLGTPLFNSTYELSILPEMFNASKLAVKWEINGSGT